MIMSLRDQWVALVGYQVDVRDDQLLWMINHGVMDLHGFSQSQWNGDALKDSPTVKEQMVWAQWGLSSETYAAHAETFAEQYKKATGQDAPPGALDGAFKGVGGAPFSSTAYYSSLLQNTELQKTYGWLKYGMDYASFQQQKLGMTQAFGHVLTDAEGVSQLQYFHGNTGGDHTVHAQGPAQKPEVGAGQSVIR